MYTKKKTNRNMKCLQCSNNATQCCSQCLQAHYCSHECQLIDWQQNHSNVCLVEGAEKRERDDRPVVTFESFIRGKREETKQIITLPLGQLLTESDLPNFWLPHKTMDERDGENYDTQFGIYQDNGHTFLVNLAPYDYIFYTPKETYDNNFILLLSNTWPYEVNDADVLGPVKLNIGDRFQFFDPERPGKCKKGECLYGPEIDDADVDENDERFIVDTYICNPIYEVIALPNIDEYLGNLKKPRTMPQTKYPTEAEIHELSLAGEYEILERRLKQVSVKSILLDRINKGELAGGQMGLDKNVWYDILVQTEVKTLLGMITKIPFVAQIVYENTEKFWKDKTMNDFPELFISNSKIPPILDKSFTRYPWRNIYMVFRYFVKKYREYWFQKQNKHKDLYSVTYDFSKSPHDGTKRVTFSVGDFSPVETNLSFFDALKDTRNSLLTYWKSITDNTIYKVESTSDPVVFFRSLFKNRNIRLKLKVSSESMTDLLSRGYVYTIDGIPVIGNDVKF